MEKPEFLYRGISISANKFQELNLCGDMRPIAPQEKNSQGRDIVSDGNEYGIYMTTNLYMAQDTYGNSHHEGELYMQEPLYVDYHRMPQYVHYPKIGIVYEINTSNLPIKKPWIQDALKGHYNNGFRGDEWITSAENGEHLIPKENLSIKNIVIGYDILNEREKIEVSGLTEEEIKLKVASVLQKRTEGYELLIKLVKKIPENRRSLVESQMRLYTKLFNSKNGIVFADFSKCDENNINEVVGYLMQKVYNRNRDEIDMEAMDILLRIPSNVQTKEQLVAHLKALEASLKTKIKQPDIRERAKEGFKSILSSLSKITDDLNNLLEVAPAQFGE